MKKKGLFVINLLFLNCFCFSQQTENKTKFSIAASYGLAGSFEVRRYVESLPFPSSTYQKFSKKNFVGNSQEFGIGYQVSKNYELNVGIQFQHYTRKVKVVDTLTSVVVFLDNTIDERNYIYFAKLLREIKSQRSLFHVGLGLYYIRPQSESIEYAAGIPDFYSDYEARYNNSKQEEGGTLVEFNYEYKFQPKVNIGIKTQFYYTLSAWYAESITLSPYIKILF